MENFQPTHFIEQFNAIGIYKNFSNDVKFTAPVAISHLKEFLEDTAKMDTHRTVAVFKIMFKKKDHGKNSTNTF